MHDLAYKLKIKDFLRVPLCRMALPGTHGAGTYGIPAEGAKLQLTPDASPVVRALFARGLQATVRDWTMSQAGSLLDQMNAGARYLDLRVAGEVLLGPSMSPERIAPALCHSFRSIRVSDALEQVEVFLRANTREVVIIDFRGFHGVNGQQHVEVVNMLRKRLGKMLVNPAHGARLSLEYLEPEFAGVGRAIVVYGTENESSVVAQHADMLWPRDCLGAPWSDDAHAEPAAPHRVSDLVHAGWQPSRFVVTQAVPDAEPGTPGDAEPHGSARYRGAAAGIVMLDGLDADKARSIIRCNIPPDAMQATPGDGPGAVGPALAAVGRPVYMAWRAACSNRLVYRKAVPGAGGRRQGLAQVLDGTEAEAEAPAMCEFQGQAWVAWKATDGEGSVCVAPIDGAEGTWRLQCDGVRMATHSCPSIASFRGRLYVFWRAIYQDQLVYAVSNDGIHWQGAFIAGAGVHASESGPAVAVWRDRLYMVWCSAHAHRPVYAVHDGSSHYGSSWTEPQRISGDQITRSTPAVMAGEDGHLYVAWRTASAHQGLVYACSKEHDHWSAPTAVPLHPASDEASPAEAARARAFGAPGPARGGPGLHLAA
ncbi:hypothetical protein AAFF27_09715 [Xylophilus sp. GW821-FHT01B05]